VTTVAYKNGQIVSDSILNSGGLKAGEVWKIARHEKTGALCGAAGDAGECMELLTEFRTHGFPDGQNYVPGLSENAIGLMVKRTGKIYMVQRHVVYPIEAEFYAIGSGDAFAMAVMRAGLGAYHAVRVAMELDDGSGGKIRVLRHDKRAPCTE